MALPSSKRFRPLLLNGQAFGDDYMATIQSDQTKTPDVMLRRC